MIFVFLSLFIAPVFLRLIRVKDYFNALFSVAISYAVLTAFTYSVFQIGINYSIFKYFCLVFISIPFIYEIIVFIIKWNKNEYSKNIFKYIIFLSIIIILFIIFSLITVKRFGDYSLYIDTGMKVKYKNMNLSPLNSEILHQYIYNYQFYISTIFSQARDVQLYFNYFLSFFFAIFILFTSFQILEHLNKKNDYYKIMLIIIVITSDLFCRGFVTFNWTWIGFVITSFIYIFILISNGNSINEKELSKNIFISDAILLLAFGVSQDAILMCILWLISRLILLLTNKFYIRYLSVLPIVIFISLQIFNKNYSSLTILKYFSFIVGLISIVSSAYLISSRKYFDNSRFKLSDKINLLINFVSKNKIIRLVILVSILIIFVFAIPLIFYTHEYAISILPVLILSILIIVLTLIFPNNYKILLIFMGSVSFTLFIIEILSIAKLIVWYSLSRFIFSLVLNIPLIVIIFIDWNKLFHGKKYLMKSTLFTTVILTGNLYTVSPLYTTYSTNISSNLFSSPFNKKDQNYLSEFVYSSNTTRNKGIFIDSFSNGLFTTPLLLYLNTEVFYYNWDDNSINYKKQLLFGEVKKNKWINGLNEAKRIFDIEKKWFNQNYFKYLILTKTSGWINHVNKISYKRIYLGGTMEIWERIN
ncbi:MAG: hypothetical protein NC236_00365 [Mycoplasma sp.]|nr:hypothetical protein [Mycoplasma sp.]